MLSFGDDKSKDLRLWRISQSLAMFLGSYSWTKILSITSVNSSFLMSETSLKNVSISDLIWFLTLDWFFSIWPRRVLRVCFSQMGVYRVPLVEFSSRDWLVWVSKTSLATSAEVSLLKLLFSMSLSEGLGYSNGETSLVSLFEIRPECGNYFSLHLRSFSVSRKKWFYLPFSQTSIYSFNDCS